MMKRWNIAESRMIESEKVDAFLNELIAVSKKHGLCIGHEDIHGSFLVHEYTEENAEWLLAASDDTGITSA